MKVLLEQRSRQPLLPLVMNHLASRTLVRRAALARESRGQPFAVYANDWVGLNVNIHGVYEGDELQLLFDFLKPLQAVFSKGVALDIGGNVGNHSVYFSRRFAAVHAFEPHPRTYELLRFNAGYRTNIQTHNYGLGDAPGRFKLFEDQSNFGGARIRDDGVSEEVPVYHIEVQRLDDSELDLSALCFVKIDVEGFEARVIRGAARTLALRQPVVVFEQLAAEFNNQAQETEAINLLRELGYQFCWNSLGATGRPWWLRRMINMAELITGHLETSAIITGATVPAKSHSMLIAVPPRFVAALGLGSA